MAVEEQGLHGRPPWWPPSAASPDGASQGRLGRQCRRNQDRPSAGSPSERERGTEAEGRRERKRGGGSQVGWGPLIEELLYSSASGGIEPVLDGKVSFTGDRCSRLSCVIVL